jgi:hypothetical protein
VLTLFVCCFNICTVEKEPPKTPHKQAAVSEKSGPNLVGKIIVDHPEGLLVIGEFIWLVLLL